MRANGSFYRSLLFEAYAKSLHQPLAKVSTPVCIYNHWFRSDIAPLWSFSEVTGRENVLQDRRESTAVDWRGFGRAV